MISSIRFLFILPALLIGAVAPGARAAADDLTESSPFINRLQPVPKNSGFKMDDHWVWCGSVIKVGDDYHMFASRWPKKTHFPEDYRTHSEIVRAVSKNPLGPYEFKEVVIARRDGGFWDSGMAHNPEIHKIGDTFVLYYIGSDGVTMQKNGKYYVRKTGCATAKSIEGPWHRGERPLINQESNNPSVYLEAGGPVKMIFRGSLLRNRVATAPAFDGPFKIVNQAVWPDAELEDFTLFKHGGKYHFICEDNRGKITGRKDWGAHFVSENGVDGWRLFTPAAAYTREIKFTDGTSLECVRRERPQLLIQNGRATHLVTSVWDGKNAWSQVVEISPSFAVENHEAK
ncbi:MAG: glycoside hydrolase family protein [Opitutaceae bacterium]|nr:glycoside hydrolase family protein [Opitutaceae bacterium]